MTIILLAFNISLTQANTNLPLAQIMNETDKNEVLKIIDHDCADSWCSGDYNYKFLTFNCNDITETCTLSFTIIDRDVKPGEVNSRNRRCIFKGITSKEKIFTGATLNEEFYDQLTYCISSREAK